MSDASGSSVLSAAAGAGASDGSGAADDVEEETGPMRVRGTWACSATRVQRSAWCRKFVPKSGSPGAPTTSRMAGRSVGASGGGGGSKGSLAKARGEKGSRARARMKEIGLFLLDLLGGLGAEEAEEEGGGSSKFKDQSSREVPGFKGVNPAPPWLVCQAAQRRRPWVGWAAQGARRLRTALCGRKVQAKRVHHGFMGGGITACLSDGAGPIR